MNKITKILIIITVAIISQIAANSKPVWNGNNPIVILADPDVPLDPLVDAVVKLNHIPKSNLKFVIATGKDYSSSNFNDVYTDMYKQQGAILMIEPDDSLGMTFAGGNSFFAGAYNRGINHCVVRLNYNMLSLAQNKHQAYMSTITHELLHCIGVDHIPFEPGRTAPLMIAGNNWAFKDFTYADVWHVLRAQRREVKKRNTLTIESYDIKVGDRVSILARSKRKKRRAKKDIFMTMRRGDETRVFHNIRNGIYFIKINDKYLCGIPGDTYLCESKQFWKIRGDMRI